jgi:hypothetical protein
MSFRYVNAKHIILVSLARLSHMHCRLQDGLFGGYSPDLSLELLLVRV